MEALLGNARLQAGLAAAFASDRLSHCYLLAGPEGSGKHTLARILSAAMECTAGSKRPCGVCLQCRKVLDNVHPDVITVDDPAKKSDTSSGRSIPIFSDFNFKIACFVSRSRG